MKRYDIVGLGSCLVDHIAKVPRIIGPEEKINVQAVITGLLKKVISPTMLIRAGSLMDQVSKDVEMNVTQAQLNTLIRDQLSTNAKWYIQSVDLTGTGGRDYCYSASDQLLYVSYPDETRLAEIIDLANIVEEGGTLPEGEVLN